MKKLWIRLLKGGKKPRIIAGAALILILLILLLLVLRPYSGAQLKNPYELIPDNAFAVFKVQQPKKFLFNNQNSPALMAWAELPGIKSFIDGVVFTDSILSKTSSGKGILDSSCLFISLHPEGIDKIAVLYVLEPKRELDYAEVFSESKSQLSSITEARFDEHEGYLLNDFGMKAAPAGTCLLASSSEPLLITALNHQDKPSSLSENDAFNRASDAATGDLNVMLCLPKLYRSLGLLASGQTYPNLAFLSSLSDWGSIEIKLNNENAILSGFFPGSQHDSSFLSVFNEPVPEAGRLIFPMLPANTSAVYSFGSSSFEEFFKAYMNRIELDRKLAFNHQRELSLFNDMSESSHLEQILYKHINGPLTVFAAGDHPLQEHEVFCAFSVDDAETVKKDLLSQAEGNEKWDTANFKQALLFSLPADYGAYSLFGPLFQSIHSTCVAVTDKGVYIGSSFSGLKTMLGHVLSGHTFESSQGMRLETTIPAEWNAFASVRFPHSFYYFSNRWLSDQSTVDAMKNWIASGVDGILAFSVSQQNGGMVFSGIWSFGQSTDHQSADWFLSFDDEVVNKPVVLNPADNESYYVAIADEVDNVYLADSEGRQLWKMNVGDKCRGDFRWLAGKNKDQHCIAFTTRHALYVVDLKGKIRKGFPVTINDGLSSDLLVVDYEKNHQYRLLVVDDRGVLRNYNMDGQATPGWKSPESDLEGEKLLYYRPLQGKDYLVMTSSSGNKYELYNRKGDRLKVFDHLSFNLGFPGFFVTPDKDSWAVLSTDGSLISLAPDGTSKLIYSNKEEQVELYTSDDRYYFLLTGQKIFQVGRDDGQKVRVYERAGNQLSDFCLIRNEPTLMLILDDDGELRLINMGQTANDSLIGNKIKSFDAIKIKQQLIILTVKGTVLSAQTFQL